MNPQCLTSLLLFLAVFWTGSDTAFCKASTLRSVAGSTTTNLRTVTSEETVPDYDVVGIRSFVVIQVDGFDLEGLASMTPKQKSIFDCALHQAFDEIHGDHDGLYLSGQQIVATDEEEPDDEIDEGTTTVAGEVDFKKKKKYVHRPRKFPSKSRDRPYYPPPKPPKRQHKSKKKFNIYDYYDSSGACSLCPDDDDFFDSSFLRNGNNKKAKLASEFLTSEDSLDAIADALRANLIEGSCVDDSNDDFFEYVQDVDIFVLSQNDFEDSIAAMETYARGIADSKDLTSEAVAMTSEDSNSVTQLLPYYYKESTELEGNDSTNGRFKIGLSGVGCGPWDQTALLDMNAGIHDAINAMGFVDKGHVVDKIVESKKQPKTDRHYVWKCHYDIYAQLDLQGSALDNDALQTIGDALCDDLTHYGGTEKFETVIDCKIKALKPSEYEMMVATSEQKAKISPMFSAPE